MKRYEISWAIVTSEKHAAQHCEKLRKSFFLNYKSAALPAELCRRKKPERAYKSYNVKTETSERHYNFTLSQFASGGGKTCTVIRVGASKRTEVRLFPNS